MGTIPPERAGMASGISTTSRFCGILLGFAGIGAVLASSMRSAGLDGLLRHGFESGFAHGFLAAGMAAAGAAAIVQGCMRDGARSIPHALPRRSSE
jgi:hypothetical protein